MPEITLEQTGTDDVKDLVSLTSMIDRLLPDEDTKIRSKLRIKIYNLSRTRNWPWVTVKKRRYYKPDTANIIIGSVSDYADALKNKEAKEKEETAKAKENQEKAKAEEKEKKTPAPAMKAKDIIDQATHKDNLSSDMEKKLRDRVSYIAKINFIKPVEGKSTYNAKDGKQIALELGTYYQQLKTDLHLVNKEKEKNNNQSKNKQEKKRNNSGERHPFEIKNNRNNSHYRNNYSNNRKWQKNTQKRTNNSADLQERYDNLLRDYADLQEKYARVLNEKNNLINEKANQLFNRYDSLKEILTAVLKRM